MLNSKYLTQDGIERLFHGICDIGYRYIYYDPEMTRYVLSLNEPMFKDGEFIGCVGNRLTVVNFFLMDILEDMLAEWGEDEYVDILDYVDETDWSQVPVDTKVLVETEVIGHTCDHFAKYENGKVYIWANGKTSWSSIDEDNVISLPSKIVHLAKEDN